MKKEHIDSELYEILHFTPKTTPAIQNKINTAYERICNNTVPIRKKTRKKHPFLYVAAALILAFGFWGFNNPALAGKIPYIGRIFLLVEDKIGYPGNFSENAVPVTPLESEETTNDTSSPHAKIPNKDTSNSISDTNIYSQTAGDITITLSEASYTEMALYFSVELYSKEGFPDDFNKVKNMKEYILSYDILNMQCSQTFDFSQADLPVPYSIEGNYADSHTFLGVIRVDLETIRNILEVESLPTEFVYSFTIQKFWGSLNETKEVVLTTENGETTTIQQAAKKYYDGPWNFTIPVSLDMTDTQTKEIMKTNADGIGISTVTRTLYEIKADIILPDNADPLDYVVAITDADGNLLDAQGNIAQIYSTYGRNIDTVHIYVVDYFTFMDECKAENAYLLPQKALFQTTVEW